MLLFYFTSFTLFEPICLQVRVGYEKNLNEIVNYIVALFFSENFHIIFF